MSIDFTAGLSYMLQDAGVSVSCGSVTHHGIEDVEDVLRDDLQVRERVVRVETGRFPALAEGVAITVNGRAYVVRWHDLDPADGALTRIVISDA